MDMNIMVYGSDVLTTLFLLRSTQANLIQKQYFVAYSLCHFYLQTDLFSPFLRAQFFRNSAIQRVPPPRTST